MRATKEKVKLKTYQLAGWTLLLFVPIMINESIKPCIAAMRNMKLQTLRVIVTNQSHCDESVISNKSWRVEHKASTKWSRIIMLYQKCVNILLL